MSELLRLAKVSSLLNGEVKATKKERDKAKENYRKKKENESGVIIAQWCNSFAEITFLSFFHWKKMPFLCS